MNDFEQAIRAHGLRPKKAVVADGRWNRCPTDDHPKSTNGTYKLALDGRVGFYQNHATDAAPVTWFADGESKEAQPRVVDFEAIRRQRAEQRVAEIKASEAARAFYDSCEPLRGGHPYLESHGLDMAGCFGLRVDRDGWLVIPAYRKRLAGGHRDPDGSWVEHWVTGLISLQRIAPGPVPEGEPSKKFWYGAPFSGVSYVVDRPGASVSILCEGLATGLAIYAAAPGTRLVIAFTGGNMAKVAERFPFPGMVAVAADNDHRTVCPMHRKNGLAEPFAPWEDRPEGCTCNPGRCYAATAADVLGCGVMLPEGIAGTDYADLRQERLKGRIEGKVYGRHETESTIRRAVDAEIAMAVQRAMRFRVPNLPT